MRHARKDGLTGSIYALADPEDGEIRYIGQAINVQRRLRTHVAEARKADRALDAQTGRRRNWYRLNWLRSLPECEPALIVLETLVDVTVVDLCEAEVRWIRWARDAGMRLTNLTEGGEGGVGRVVTAEERETLRANALRQFTDPDARQRVSQGLKNYYAAHPERRGEISASLKAHYAANPWTPERRAEHSAVLRAYNAAHPESREQAAAAMRGRKLAPELAAARSAALHNEKWRAAMAARIGMPMDPAHVAKAVAGRRANGGFGHSAESKQKMRERRLGKRMSEETKAKIGAGVREARARKRLSA